jgi:hypothetical protein
VPHQRLDRAQDSILVAQDFAKNISIISHSWQRKYFVVMSWPPLGYDCRSEEQPRQWQTDDSRFNLGVAAEYSSSCKNDSSGANENENDADEIGGQHLPLEVLVTVYSIAPQAAQAETHTDHCPPNSVSRSSEQLVGKFGSSPIAKVGPSAVNTAPQPMTGGASPAMADSSHQLDVTA